MSGGGDRPRRIADAVEVELDGEIVIYEPDSGTVSRLNHSAATIWSWLDGESSIIDIASALETEYGLDAHEARRAVDDVVAALERGGVLDH